MPTNFPTSVDNFTNPTANDSLNLPSHSTQHANANDAIEAVEDYLLNGVGKNGLVLIKTQVVGTGVSTVTVSNAFSATYDNYKVLYTDGVGSTIMNISCIMGATASGYSSSRFYNSPASGTVTGNGLSAQSNWGYFGQGGTNYVNIDCDFINPFATKYTRYNGTYNIDNSFDSTFGTTQGFVANTTSYTAFTLTPAGTLTGGTIYVFGYRKS